MQELRTEGEAMTPKALLIARMFLLLAGVLFTAGAIVDQINGGPDLLVKCAMAIGLFAMSGVLGIRVELDSACEECTCEDE